MQARPKRLEHQMTDKGLVPVYAKGTVSQPYESYSQEDHHIWGDLMGRQEQVLQTRACQEWLDARKMLGLTPDAIPRFDEINRTLGRASGWQLVGVEGLLDANDYYQLLANRQFPATWWIRAANQLDYVPEPDLFHDLYGHVPLLTLPVYADYIAHYASTALRVSQSGSEAIELLTRLDWFTIEFGLMGTAENPKIYGAGIMSSFKESTLSVDDPSVQRVPFDPDVIMAEPFKIDQVQHKYFVVPDLDTLYRQLKPVLERF